MVPLFEPDELSIVNEIVQDPKAAFYPQASLLLLIHGGLSVRQVAGRTGFSPSGVQYWVNRFRRLRLKAFDLDENTIGGGTASSVKETKPPGQSEKKKSRESQSDHPKPTSRDEQHSIFDTLSLPETLDKPGILATDSLALAGKKILLFHFIQMLKNEAGTIDGVDIEALHDMRVATRRMRAAFGVFGDEYSPKSIKPILKGLRRTGRALGEVRDLDVFMEKANHYLTSLPPEKKADLDPLFHIWQEQRSAGRERMVSYLESDPYHKFLFVFSDFLTNLNSGITAKNVPEKGSQVPVTPDMPSTVQSAVPLLVYTILASVNAYDQILHNANITQLHALRIELKRLRYTLEFFNEVLGAEANDVIKAIKILQDHLGDLNDANVACNLLSDILIDWENLHGSSPLLERPNPEPIVAYLAYRADERHRLLVTFPSAWEKFRNPEVRKKLALAIAAL